jgi:hypothetical protein
VKRSRLGYRALVANALLAISDDPGEDPQSAGDAVAGESALPFALALTQVRLIPPDVQA